MTISFVIATFKPSQAKLANAMREHILSSEEIVNHKAQTLEAREANATRILRKDVCKFCDVRPLCMSEYDGGNINVMVNTEFKQRDYGYNSEQPKIEAQL